MWPIIVLMRGVTTLRFVFYRKRTLGFASRIHRADHFQRHRRRLGIPPGLLYEVIYEKMADVFIGNPLGPRSDEFSRRWNGDVVRYDKKADVFAIKTTRAVIKTYYRPDPAVHGLPTNWDYYLSEKAKA